IAAVCCFIVNADQVDVTPDTVPAGVQSAADAGAQPAAVQPAATAGAKPAAGQTPSPADAAPSDVAAPATADARAADQKADDDASPASESKEASEPAAEPARPARKAAKAAKKSAAPASSTLRVGVEKVDQIINLVGELVITQAMLVETAQSLDPVVHDRLINGIEQFERNARDLQEAVMSIRMIPMDYVFSRFPRVVRESATAMNKRIRLVTHGQATELDKSLIERIIDPLTHLVRNSIDHGIELPEDRIKAGKDPEGVLTLSAQHSGGHIVIQVSDDGAGLNRERILAKAIAQGFAVNENTPDDEPWQPIFAPGFSTADKVTAISGRGVGMDVVRRNIQGMGGHIHLSSVKGKGTTTRIILPLTLAILDGMSVRVGDETFILPLSNVMESMQPEADQIRQISETERVLYVRGEYLPLVALHDIFDVQGAETEVTNAITVILKAEEVRFALQVDHLVGQHQVVVKNLEANYRKIPGISAATILGDGSVALIVDVFALMRMTQTSPALGGPVHRIGEPHAESS
ncbi:MAG TPA: chemotaxis protein CheW, partial [Burkholderiaceae bacterium]|nr:chemotaxis protein CheW [Burkholderiaceae bacterium]